VLCLLEQDISRALFARARYFSHEIYFSSYISCYVIFLEQYFSSNIASYSSSSSSAAIAYSSSCLHELLKQHINLWTLLGSIGYSSTSFMSCSSSSCMLHCMLHSCCAPPNESSSFHSTNFLDHNYGPLLWSSYSSSHIITAPGIISRFKAKSLCSGPKSGHGSTFCEC
jgi:hypothetical protein